MRVNSVDLSLLTARYAPHCISLSVALPSASHLLAWFRRLHRDTADKQKIVGLAVATAEISIDGSRGKPVIEVR